MECSKAEMNEPLMQRAGSLRGAPSLWLLYGVSFLRALAMGVASLPACSLRMLDLVVASGGDWATAALIVGLISALRHVTEFVAGNVLAHWSEDVGRQPVLLISSAAFVVESACMALASSPWLAGAAHVVGGILFSGGLVESRCIEDQLKEEEPYALAHGRLFAAVGAALALGPALGGTVALRYGSVGSFACAHALGVLAVAGVALFLPEYMPLRYLRRRRARRVSWAVPGALAGSGATGRLSRATSAEEAPDRPMLRAFRNAPRLKWFCLALALNGLGMSSYAAVNVLWIQASLGWDSHELGVFVALGGCLQLLVEGAVLPLAIQASCKLTRRPLEAVAKVCLAMNALKFIGFTLARDQRWMVATLVVAAPGFCSTSVIVALCTRQLPKTVHKPWEWALSVLNTVASVLGALVGSWLLAASLRGARILGLFVFSPGVPLLFNAACYFLAGACVAQAEQCAPPVRPPGPTRSIAATPV